ISRPLWSVMFCRFTTCPDDKRAS
ncbi:hypothetical protein VCHENC02_3541B, partial [Vibrio harveyi]